MNSNQPIVHEDLSLYGLFSIFIKNWLILTVSGFSFAVAALIWSLYQPNIYKAETLLMPVENDKSSLSGLAGNIGGLASLAGVNLSDSGNNNSKLAIELLKSRKFLTHFIEKNDLLIPLMAVKSWDITSNKLLIDQAVYNSDKQQWVRKAKAPRNAKPSLIEAYEKLITMLEVDIEPKTKFVRISLEYFSPDLAAQWTQSLVAMLNEEVRMMDKKEAEESIVYLKQLASEANVAGLRNVFSSLMEEQIKSQMLAEIRKDYVFKVVDPAIAPELKSKPRRAIIVVVAGFLGGIIGIIIVLFRTGRKSYISSKV
ncbi:Wzz/FepE/Etk N-terminal domain-containing protein [Colwelliaceae bacterium 6471]